MKQLYRSRQTKGVQDHYQGSCRIVLYPFSNPTVETTYQMAFLPGDIRCVDRQLQRSECISTCSFILENDSELSPELARILP